ncbi:MAG: dsDNA nuclease domain-containing protein [bacterium]|nr:dsDNA nuclease domain-containing protein [bacterium]
MDLTKKLLSVPERENAGARSSNRFTFQQVWAFDYMLKVLESNLDFALFMEFHDDVIVLNRLENEEYIEFFQIKTDAKDSRYITSSFITKNGSKYPEKMSIIQKMIDEFVKFEDDTRGIHLVSNKSFDFGKFQDDTESKNRSKITLNEINDTNIKKLKADMCKACNKKNNCNDECLSVIYFDVADLDLVSYDDTVMGRMIRKLEDMNIPSTIERTRSIYNTILGEIRRINNVEKSTGCVEELMKSKAISKTEFLQWISRLKVEMPDDLWNQIHLSLITDGFKPLEVNKIHREWKKYQIERMNIEALGLQEIVKKIQNIMGEKDFDNCKEWTEYIYNKLSIEPEALIYNRYYLYAMIVKEMFD